MLLPPSGFAKGLMHVAADASTYCNSRKGPPLPASTPEDCPIRTYVSQVRPWKEDMPAVRVPKRISSGRRASYPAPFRGQKGWLMQEF